jgi:hypothetical protein
MRPCSWFWEFERSGNADKLSVFSGLFRGAADPPTCGTVTGTLDRRAAARISIPVLAFALTLALRVHGISRHFPLLGDQIRDWGFALGPFGELPLVGPATHVGGYTIGPAFYWILWAIRILVGPWFDNLPHAGGIGQAIVQSGADALLLFAIWRRTGSIWIAMAAVVLIATAPHDLALSALVWNPTMGEALAKIATALVLIGWPLRSVAGVAVTTAVAWSAVHAYTGAIFVTAGVLAAILGALFVRGEHARGVRSAAVIAIVIALLQVPLIVYQLSNRTAAMGAVTGSVGRILSGQALPDFAGSWTTFAGALTFIQGAPFTFTPGVPWHEHGWLAWVLVPCAVLVTITHRRDPALLAVTILPLALTVIGYAFFLGHAHEAYYYLSLMPAAVLTVLLAVTTLPSAQAARAVGVAVAVASLAIVPPRVRFASTLPRMPEYAALVDGSRRLVDRGFPVRTIRTEFQLPHTANREFIYRILGGRIDASSPVSALITRDGDVSYQRAQ